MKDSVKIGTAVVGGYVLGRTKKGKLAIGLALWLSGNRMTNSREALLRLAASPELGKLTAQLRGPLLGAAQRALTATVESRTAALADSLQQRTSQLLAVRDAGTEESAADDYEDEGEREEQAEPEPPRQAKRPAKAARRSPAGRSPGESREPTRRRESSRRSAPRGGEVA